MSFVFFDTETTGLRRGFDQVIQFAALLTDNELNVLDQFEVRSRLLPYVVPHPGALLTNGRSIAQLTDRGLPSHYEMVRAIQRTLLSWSPSIYVGYNSIRFDEEMLRHALFQTLHPAFLTSNHRNGRADALGLMMVASALAPNCLRIPIGPEGRPIFRLERMALENGIAQHAAHDALGDAVATLELCKRVYEQAPELWTRFVRFSKKATVTDFVDSGEAFILTEFFKNEAYHSPVICLGQDPEQSNGRLCLRLDCDLTALMNLDSEKVRAELHKRPSPIRRLRVNAAPALTPLFEATDGMLGGTELETVEERARRIVDDPSFVARLVAAYSADREPRAPSTHVEDRIYDSLTVGQDEWKLAEFHEVAWSNGLSLVQSLDDERLREFGLRLIYCECRSVLPIEIRLKVERSLTNRLTDQTAGGLTLEDALTATDELISQGADTGQLLVAYRDYLLARMARVDAYRSTLVAASTV